GGNGAFAWALRPNLISQISSSGPSRTSARGRLTSIGTLLFKRSANFLMVPSLSGPKHGIISCPAFAQSMLPDAVVEEVIFSSIARYKGELSKSSVSCMTRWTYNATCRFQATMTHNNVLTPRLASAVLLGSSAAPAGARRGSRRAGGAEQSAAPA